MRNGARIWCTGILLAASSALAIDMRTSVNSRMVLTWHPIFELKDREVWQEIATHGLEYHPVSASVEPPERACFSRPTAGPGRGVLRLGGQALVSGRDDATHER